MSAGRGFTLIEVLVALTLAALVMITVAQAVSLGGGYQHRARETTAAALLADEAMQMEVLGSGTDQPKLSQRAVQRGWHLQVARKPSAEITGMDHIHVTLNCPNLGRTIALDRWVPSE